jgi:glutathione S-transferase
MTLPKLIIGNKKYSSWSLRPWIALKAAGMAFEEMMIPMNTPEFEAARGNGQLPTGKVPVLWVDDICIWDSLAIIDYAADMHPTILWPEDLMARAVARSMCAEMHSGFVGLRMNLPMVTLRTFENFTPNADAQADIHRIEKLWTLARTRYGTTGPYLFGKFSAADCMFAPVVLRFNSYGIKFSSVAQTYVDAMLDHPHMKEWMAGAAQETHIIAKYEA